MTTHGDDGAKAARPATDELFAKIEEQADLDEMDRILAMDDAALDAELAQGGYDPAKVRADGRALGEKLAKAARHARLVRGAKVAGVAAGIVALLVAAVLLTRPAPQPPAPRPGVVPEHEPTGDLVTSPEPSPAKLRERAMSACDAHEWRRCLELLDRAREDDPAGDDSPAVRTARDRAARGLARDP
jgi:hypothetical protein